MSPSAIGDPPHTRAAPINGGAPVAITNGLKSSRMDGLRGSNRVFLHLDDLLLVTPGEDIRMPLRTWLAKAEACAKTAETQLDFKRPDLSLQEFMKASIMEEMLPLHKDYPELQRNTEDLRRLHSSLKMRLSSYRVQLPNVKEAIRENNARNGVQPSGSTKSTSNGWRVEPREPTNGHSRTSSSQSSAINGTIPTDVPRKKPPIQPKPEALHGKALVSPNGSRPASPQMDLVARFARLRSPDTNAPPPMQDPRIKTHPIKIPQQSGPSSASPSTAESHITMNRLKGPREMPSVPKALPQSTRTSISLEIPNMPKQPAPIYSPDRGADNGMTANLPTSIARNSSSIGRTNSAPPISTVRPTPNIVENKKDYFSATHSLVRDPPPTKNGKEHTFPESSTVSAENLMEYLRQGSQALRVLVVDVRSREDFENGHIMAPSIICVEPITLQHGISGDELANCMVLAPDNEQDLYEHRHEFDLIVFYDQSSTSCKPSFPSGFENSSKLQDFYSAIYEYSYDKRVKRRPLLLQGGLDAWVDLLGSSSLQAAPGATVRPDVRPLHPLSHSNAIRKLPLKRRKDISSRPLSKEDEKKWEAVLREETTLRSSTVTEESGPEEFIYARTTEDFLRKYPELPTMQESMISSFPQKPTYELYPDELARVMPSPPARPAPALPRLRSGGVSDRGSGAVYAHTWAPPTTTSSITSRRVPPPLTGLENPGNLCYMNSVIQACSATPFLKNLLVPYPNPKQPKILVKDGKSEHPLLMTKFLSGVLCHLWCGQYLCYKPAILARYIHSIHAKQLHNDQVRTSAFGGIQQQDAPEFMRWLFAILSDELNSLQHIPQEPLSDKTKDEWAKLSPLAAAKNVWEFYSRFTRSPLSIKLDHAITKTATCENCGFVKQFTDTGNYNMILTLSGIVNRAKQPLKEILDVLGTEETIEEYKCDSCEQTGTSSFKSRLSHLSDYLIIELARYGGKCGEKFETLITFPDKINFERYFVSADQEKDPKQLPRQMRGPFEYEVYAVIQHSGGQRSGHYWTLAKVRDEKTGKEQWCRFEDDRVSPAKWSHTQESTTYMMFLRRTDANDDPFPVPPYGGEAETRREQRL